jgi:hypothetical protein
MVDRVTEVLILLRTFTRSPSSYRPQCLDLFSGKSSGDENARPRGEAPCGKVGRRITIWLYPYQPYDKRNKRNRK